MKPEAEKMLEDKAEAFALWVFDQIADGMNEFPAAALLDKMEALGLVEAKSHTTPDVLGVLVSLFWVGGRDA